MARINIEDLYDGVRMDTADILAKAMLEDSVLGQVLRERFGYSMADQIDIFEKHVAATESPIERSFIEALHLNSFAYGLPIETLHYPPSMISPATLMPTLGLYVFPQFEVEFEKKYRADFLLVTNDRQRDVLRKLVVECDGHDFHEKTKEQAQRDKSRDREFVSNGYTVFRFTGAEIHADAKKCADQCLSFLSRVR